MNNGKWIWLFTVLMVLALTGCSKKADETSEPSAEATTASAPTPIDQSTVGDVAGKVTFEGTKPKPQRIMMDQDPVCVQKHSGPVFAEDNQVNADGTLPNVFVYVKSGAEKYTFATPTEPVVLDQNGCMYQPHVLGIMVGQTLKVVSSDPTTHNIHPMPKDNQEWNMSQMAGAAPIEKKFARPEIMVPNVCTRQELVWVKPRVERIHQEVEKRYNVKIKYKFGTMVEIARACVRAARIAEVAEFFSFGTNDLTQGTFSFSREDAENKFLPIYNTEGILRHNPFEILDELGVGWLMQFAVTEGRKTRPDLKIGICGEHGGQPQAVEFCHRIGLNYVSCSPMRIPIARMAAAHAMIKEKKGAGERSKAL